MTLAATDHLPRSFAAAWGTEFIDIGAAGHINTASGFGPWPFGEVLLERLRREAALPADASR